MDARQLEVFLAVARHGSFTRAAAELHLVQSAVSSTVAALERELGQRLFDRTTRQVGLTAAGEALLEPARDVLGALTSARDAVDAVRGRLGGTLRIGYMTNVALFDIPRLLRHFTDDHPAVRMQLSPSTTGTAGLAGSLRQGDLDIAFLAGTPDDFPDLRIDVLARSPLGLTVAPDHALARRRRMVLRDTAAEDFIELPEGFGTRTNVDTAFRHHGLHRTVVVETSDILDVAALVRHGLGVAFLPRYLTDGDDSLRWIAVTDADLEMCVSVATPRHRAPTAAAARLAALARPTVGRPATS